MQSLYSETVQPKKLKLPTDYKITSNVCSSTREVLPRSRPVFLLWQHVGWSTQHSYTALLPDRMWVRELSRAQPCSKTAPFISPVTRLCNAAVWMCIVGGGVGGGCVCFPCVCVCWGNSVAQRGQPDDKLTKIYCSRAWQVQYTQTNTQRTDYFSTAVCVSQLLNDDGKVPTNINQTEIWANIIQSTL